MPASESSRSDITDITDSADSADSAGGSYSAGSAGSTNSAGIVVILNAGAGPGHAREQAERIEAGFRACASSARVVLAASGDEMLAAARQGIADGAGKLVAAGGDGTVNAVASIAIGSDCAFGVLPLGTLNHFAKDLAIPLELDAAIRNIVEGRTLVIDTAEVNGRSFINNSSLGLYPDIVHEREKQQSRLGRGKWLAFCWATFGALRRYPFLDVTVLLDGQEHHRRTPFVFIGNNDYNMEGLNIGTRAALDGGKLSLYVCHRTGRLGLLRLAWNALRGRLREVADFDMLSAAEINIATRHRKMRVATDGEIGVMATPLRYRIRRASLKVLVPHGAAGLQADPATAAAWHEVLSTTIAAHPATGEQT